MQDRPSAPELLAAVAHFLNDEVTPTLSDPRLKYRALVAANLLAIVTRELELGATLEAAEQARLVALLHTDTDAGLSTLNTELARQIRAGAADEDEYRDAVIEHVRQTVIEKLEIANPKYLAKFDKNF